MRTLLLTCLLISAVVTAPEKRRKAVQMRMQRHPLLREKLRMDNRMEQFVAQQEASLNAASGSGQLPLQSYADGIYTVHIKMGTPPQIFSVMVDDSISMLWLIDSSCTSADCMAEGVYAGYLYERAFFNSSASSTFWEKGEAFSISYGGAAGTSVFAAGYDVIDLAGMTFASQGFGTAVQLAPAFGTLPVDGALGLGWPALAADGIVPPVQNLLDQFDQPIFTTYLTRHQKLTPFAIDGGMITFGGFDDANCDSEITYASLTSKSYWQFKIDRFSFGDFTASGAGASGDKGYQAVTNSGQSYLGLPYDVFGEILKQTKANYQLLLGLWTVPCDGEYPSIVFTISGVDFEVPSSQYVMDEGIQPPELGLCAIGAYTMVKTNGIQLSLGEVFMRPVCVVHDVGNERIGFARAIGEGSTSTSSAAVTSSAATSEATKGSSTTTKPSTSATHPSTTTSSVAEAFGSVLLIAIILHAF